MAKNITVDSYGFKNLSIIGLPSSVSELDAMAKKEGAALDLANAQYVAHTHLSRARKNLVAALVIATGIKLLTEKKGDKEVPVETEGQYIKRLEKEFGSDEFYAKFQDVAEKAYAATEVNFERAAREAGKVGTPGKKYLEIADDYLAKGVVEQVFAKIAPDEDVSDILDGNTWTADGRDAFANAVKEYMLAAERKAREEAAKSLAGLL
jgi:hypothetical protein